MAPLDLTGYSTGDAEDWRERYASEIDVDHGESVNQAAVTAVVVVWHQSDKLDASLTALRRAGHSLGDRLEIIVVDNAAPATLRHDTRRLWDRWIELNTNLGPAPARNLGAALAGGSVVAFVDDDGLVDPDYLANALTYFEDDDVLGLRGRIRARHHPLFSAVAGHYDRGNHPVDEALITEGASLVDRRAFLQAGGFPDEMYGHEGLELTRRLRDLDPDGRILYAPDVVLRHDYVGSWAEFVEKHLRCAANERRTSDHGPRTTAYIRNYHRRDHDRSPRSLSRLLSATLLKIIGALLQQIARVGFRVHNLFSRTRDE